MLLLGVKKCLTLDNLRRKRHSNCFHQLAADRLVHPLCLITLLVTFILGLATSALKTAEGGALSVLVSLLAICSLLVPPIGAWQLNKQEEAAKQDDGAERESNPVAEYGLDV